MGDFLVRCTRGKFGHESILVRGNIVQWLVDKKARPTKDANRFTIAGWRTEVLPLGETVVPTMEKIFDKKY